MGKIIWLKATCPICHLQYDYPEGVYKPPTCNKFECLWKYNHPEIRGRTHYGFGKS